MKVEADAFGRELEVLRRLVPTENEVPALLESVSTAARRAGLELSDVQPDGVINGDQFDTYRYKIGVTGPWHQVAEFLGNVGSMPRIVSPINLTLTTSSRSGERRPQKNEQFLDAKFGIQTYVAHASVKQRATSAGQGGSAVMRPFILEAPRHSSSPLARCRAQDPSAARASRRRRQ